MARVLATCPTQRSPEGGTSQPPEVKPAFEPASRPSVPTTKAPTTSPGTSANDPNYGTCREAKANGAGPYTKDQPEYAYYRDGDGDGTVCE